MGIVKRKVVLLGEGEVGKTSLIRKYVTNHFDEKYIVTIGTSNSKKTIMLGETQVDMIIWDLMGQHINPKMLQNYMRGTNGAIFVSDLTRPETSEQMSLHWGPELGKVSPGVPVVLAGNKQDLAAAVSSMWSLQPTRLSEQGFKVVGTYLTSARTGENVEKAFAALGKAMLED